MRPQGSQTRVNSRICGRKVGTEPVFLGRLVTPAGFFLAANPNLICNAAMSKHPAEWAKDHISAMRRNRRTPFKITRYVLQDAKLFEYLIEQLDLTAEELAAVDRVRPAATSKKREEASDAQGRALTEAA
jgi:hypothetical protein